MDFAVRNLVLAEAVAPKGASLPLPIFLALKGINQVHFAWRYYRKIDLYTKPDNFLALAAGHALNYAAGDIRLLKTSAICVLIATRILSCIEEVQKIKAECRRAGWAIRGDFIPPMKSSWSKETPPSALQRKVLRMQFRAHALKVRLHVLALSLLGIIKRIFITSMRIMDVMDAFSLSPETGREGVNELFVNYEKWMNRLVENKTLLLATLESQTELINRILVKITNNSFSANQLIEMVSSTLEKADKVHKQQQAFSHKFGQAVTEFLKLRVHEVAVETNMQRMLPHQLVPSSPKTPKTPETARKRVFVQVKWPISQNTKSSFSLTPMSPLVL